MKSAQFHPPSEPTRLANSSSPYNQSVFSATGGPLQVGYPAWVNSISSWIGLGLSALGLKELPGLSDGSIFGWGYTAFTLDPQSQTRSSSEASYLREALAETTNLLIYKNTIAKSIIFDLDKRAVGVTVESGGLVYQINATREVILSAGTVRDSTRLPKNRTLLSVLTAFSFGLHNS